MTGRLKILLPRVIRGPHRSVNAVAIPRPTSNPIVLNRTRRVVSRRFASAVERLYDRRRDAGSRSELEKESARNEPARDFNGKGGKKKYGETKNRSPGLGQAVLLKRRSAFSLPLTRSTRFVTERRTEVRFFV